MTVTQSTAMMTAFSVLAAVWPQKFARAEFEFKSKMYLRPLNGLDADVIVAAAEDWVDNNKFAPTPSEFAATAWKLHRLAHPEAPTSQIRTTDPELIAEAVRMEGVQVRLQKRAMYVLKHCRSGKLSELSEIWALLYDTAETDGDRIAVRDGTVGRSRMDATISAYHAGARAQTPVTRLYRPSVAEAV